MDKARSWFSRAVLLDPDNGDFWALYYKFEAVRSSSFILATPTPPPPPSSPHLRAYNQLKLWHPRLVMPPVVHRHAWVIHLRSGPFRTYCCGPAVTTKPLSMLFAFPKAQRSHTQIRQLCFYGTRRGRYQPKHAVNDG